MKPVHILVVDDEPGIRQSLGGVLQDEGYLTAAVESGEACLEELARHPYELVFLDVWLPGIDGMETLARIQEIPFADRPVVVMISGHGSIETAVKATKLGAFDFLEKPLSIQKVAVVAKNALDHRRLALENSRLKEGGESKYRIIGESVPMKALRQQLALMAATNGRVLIFGESGTGKELVAHAIHAMSPRAAEPFVEVNCAAIPEDLIESELFGHSKGSFTSAHETKIGKFQKANGGTLFLDEVGDMSPRTQSKVLRAIEEQRFDPGGCAGGGRHQQEPGRGDRTRQLPGRPVLSPERDPFLRAAAARPAGGHPPAGGLLSARVHHGLWAQAQGADPGGVPDPPGIPLAGQCAGAAQPDRAHCHSESPGARGCAPHSAERDPAPGGAGPGFRAFREPPGSARIGGARVHSQEAGRGQRERHANRGTAGAGAQQSLPKNEDSGDRAEGIAFRNSDTMRG